MRQSLPVPYSLSKMKWVDHLFRSFKVCCFVLLALITTKSFGQVPDPNTSCTSGDLLLVSAALPPNAGEDPCGTCTAGTTITRNLILSINNKTGSTRTSFAFWGTLEVYSSAGVLVGTRTLSRCKGPIPRNKITPVNFDTVKYECGQSLKLTNLFLAWTSASPGETCPLNPALINPKCGKLPEIQIVAGLDANAVVTNATCTTNGSIAVSPFGGKAPYKVTIGSDVRTNIAAGATTTFTNLAPATYTITISDATTPTACTTTKSRTVTAPSSIATPVATVTQPTCATATATVTITPPLTSGATYTLKQGGVTKYTANASGVFSLVIAGTYNLSASNGTCSATGDNVVVDAQPATPAAPVLSVVNNCDGTSTITAKDASNVNIPAGELTWSNGATGNPISVNTTTSVTATRTSGPCTSGNSNSVTPAPKTTSVAPILSKVDNCDGTTTITAKDGSNVNIPAGELTWSNGASGNPISVNSTTAVTATRTSNGCTSGNSNSITPDPHTTPGTPSADVTQPTCAVATGTIAVTGADATITYTLTGTSPATTTQSNNTGDFSGLAAGTYDLTASKNGCTSTAASKTVNTQPQTPGVPSANVTQPTCAVATGTIAVTGADATITYTLTGPSPATTTQSNNTGNFSGLAAGMYDLTASKNGCTSASTSKTVNAQPATPTFTVCLVNPTLCANTGSVTISASGGSGFHYSIDGSDFSNTTGVFNNLASGSVTAIKVQNSDGCISAEAACDAPSSCGSARSIAKVQSEPKAEETIVKAYPNPFNNKVKFVVTAPQTGKGTLEVFNIMGQKVKTVFQGTVNAGSNNFELTLPNQNSNLIYRLKMGQKQVTGKLLQINR